jgi:hypothetical protein
MEGAVRMTRWSLEYNGPIGWEWVLAAKEEEMGEG